jgi:hypothetical protein
MVSIPFYYVARDVIGFLRSLQLATKLPGADAGREEKMNSPVFEIALVLVHLDPRCQKGNISYLAIIRRCAIVELEFQIVAGRL